MKEDENRIDSWLSQLYFYFRLYFYLMSNFGSYVKALRKASTHLTEEPYKSSKKKVCEGKKHVKNEDNSALKCKTG